MKLRPFELILVVVFAGLAFLALVLVSAYTNSKSDEAPVIGPVTIWGTLESRSVNSILTELKDASDDYKDVNYYYIDPAEFSQRLTNALADGQGPDSLLISHEQLVGLRRRLAAIQYESFPLRDIKNTYIDGAEIFALSDGLYAYPVAVDPLVMYWNRDILSNEGLFSAPSTWEDLVNVQFPALIDRNFDRSIVRSVVAMGEYGNIRNSFATISALLLQGGSKGVVEDVDDNEYDIELNISTTGTGQPFHSALDFYTRFSRTNNTLYSWNRSFAEDRAQFTAQDLVFYFGMGSEAKELERLNPNLNFDIAEIPQGATATVRRTYGEFYGLSLLRAARNPSGAVAMMRLLANQTNSVRIATANNLVPVYRNIVAAGSNDTYGRITYKSAGVAYGWLSPARPRVDSVFGTMTRDVNENRYGVASAAQDALKRLADEY